MPLMEMQITMVVCPMCFAEASVGVTRNRETQFGGNIIERDMGNLSGVGCRSCDAELYVTVRARRAQAQERLHVRSKRNGYAKRAKRLSH